MARFGVGAFLLCFLNWHHISPISLAKAQDLGKTQTCPTQPNAPQFEMETLGGQHGMVNISDSISQLYNDSIAHLAYFFPNPSVSATDSDTVAVAPAAWVRFKCMAQYPIEIEIDSVMAVRVDNLTYARSVMDYDQPCSYRYKIEFRLKLKYSATGNYICQEIKSSGRDSAPAGANNSSVIHLFVNDGTKAALLNAQLNLLEVDEIPDDQGLIRVPCISTDPYREPQLFKGDLLMQPLQNATKAQDYVHYLPWRGFFISAHNKLRIAYTCALGTISLQIRMRNLGPNTGPEIPTHFRVGPTPRGETIYNTNLSMSINLVCESNKPIKFQWSLQDSKLSSDVRQTEVKDTYYRYKTNLLMNGKIRRNFTITCQLNKTNEILHTWSYEVSLDTVAAIRPGISLTDGDNKQRHFNCVSSESKTPLIVVITCENHMNCKMAQRFSDLISVRPNVYPFPVRTGFACYKTPGCAIIPLAVVNRTGLVMCQEEPANHNTETRVIHYQNYFTGFEGSINTEYTPSNTLRFRLVSGSDRDPAQDMSTVYVGENITFVCDASTFIFAKGIQFLVHFENGSTISAKQYEPNLRVNETSEGDVITSQVTLSIKSIDVTQIECSAPLWRAHTWWNASYNLSCAQGKTIRFSGGGEKEEVTFKASEVRVSQSITCEAWGDPKPRLHWTKDGQNASTMANVTRFPDVSLDTWQNGNGSRGFGVRSVLIFTEVKEFHNGTYVCEAENRKSVASKKFVVNLPKFEGTNTWTYVPVIIAVFGVLASAGLIWYLLRLRKRPVRDTGKLTENEITEFKFGNQDMKQKYADLHDNARYLPYKEDFEIPQNKLEIRTDEPLGSGMSGCVDKGYLTKHGTRIPVAIKTARSRDIGTLKILLSEIKILMYIGRHENVINLLGARTNELREGKLHAVVEFCHFGSLRDFMRANRDNFFDQIRDDEIKGDLRPPPQERKSRADPRKSKVISTVSWKLDDFLVNVNPDRSSSAQTQALAASSRNSHQCQSTTRDVRTIDLVRWSLQIASGMEFLGQKKVIHGDLALRNILLTEDMQVKITDFGLSRHLHDYEIYYKKRKGDMLPWRWLAIEAARDTRFSIETDIWAYAITLWEIYSLGETPYPGLSWGEEFVQKLTEGYRLPQAKYSTKGIHEVMLKCWAKNPSQRPTFTVLKQYFDGLIVISTGANKEKTLSL